jgi:hypothetical protein
MAFSYSHLRLQVEWTWSAMASTEITRFVASQAFHNIIQLSCSRPTNQIAVFSRLNWFILCAVSCSIVFFFLFVVRKSGDPDRDPSRVSAYLTLTVLGLHFDGPQIPRARARDIMPLLCYPV